MSRNPGLRRFLTSGPLFPTKNSGLRRSRWRCTQMPVMKTAATPIPAWKNSGGSSAPLSPCGQYPFRSLPSHCAVGTLSPNLFLETVPALFPRFTLPRSIDGCSRVMGLRYDHPDVESNTCAAPVCSLGQVYPLIHIKKRQFCTLPYRIRGIGSRNRAADAIRRVASWSGYSPEKKT